MGARLRQDRTADGDSLDAIESDIARSHARITQAPAAIVVCIDLRDMHAYPDERRRNAEYVMAVQSAAMAVQNLLLAADQYGLGACIMCAPLFCPDAVLEVLGLPKEWQPQLLVTLGLPDMAAHKRTRMPLSDIVKWPKAPDQPAR